jgi:hypothetical protein
MIPYRDNFWVRVLILIVSPIGFISQNKTTKYFEVHLVYCRYMFIWYLQAVSEAIQDQHGGNFLKQFWRTYSKFESTIFLRRKTSKRMTFTITPHDKLKTLHADIISSCLLTKNDKNSIQQFCHVSCNSHGHNLHILLAELFLCLYHAESILQSIFLVDVSSQWR